jgi:hypothetical protein
MALHIKRKPKQSSRGLVRDFSRRVRRSGILARAKKKKFRDREKSDQMKKRKALRKLEKIRHYKKMQKLGRL